MKNEILLFFFVFLIATVENPYLVKVLDTLKFLTSCGSRNFSMGVTVAFEELKKLSWIRAF